MRRFLAGIGLVLGLAGVAFAAPTTSFLYQGRLVFNGQAIDGSADFKLTLWTDEVGGNTLGQTVAVTNVQVVDGLFEMELDFGSEAFSTAPRWIEMAVRSPAGQGGYQTLSPRQPVMSVPHALNTRGVHVTTDENVGLGTTVPVAKLEVRSTNDEAARFLRNNSFGDQVETVMELTALSGAAVEPGFGAGLNFRLEAGNGGQTAAGGIDMKWFDPNIASARADMVFRTRDGVAGPEERMIIRHDGFVGIGRDWKINDSEILGVHADVDANDYGGMYVNVDNDLGRPFMGLAVNGVQKMRSTFFPQSDYWVLAVGSGNMTMEADTGQLAIGHYAPTARLDVLGFDETGANIARTGADSDSVIEVLNVRALTSNAPESGFGARLNFQLDAINGAYANVGSIDTVWIDPTLPGSEAKMVIRTRDNVNGVVRDRMTFMPNGFVGVGRDHQVYYTEAFGVQSPASNGAYGGMYMNTEAGGWPFYGYSDDGTIVGYHYYADDAWRLAVHSLTRMVVDASGNVGIGDTTPDERLDVVGDAIVTGNLSKGGGSFRIDHPLDPENKYLYHSFVESPDMMNVYNGNVVTDADGYAVVTMPEWFEALNRDFRYQLTVIGTFAQAIVAEEMSGNQFAIRTDQPNVKVSWLVTGVRQDKFANANRIPVEVDKPEADRGKYVHPQAWGKSVELSENYTDPVSMPRMDSSTVSE